MIEVKGHKDLVKEVIEAGLCVYCGACSGSCPYLLAYKGKIVVINDCNRAEGQCYQFCPRTPTDMDAINQAILGEPFRWSDFGTAKEMFLAKSSDDQILQRAQDGGTVTTLLSVALESGLIEAALTAKMDSEKTPNGYIARTREELLRCAGTSYEACPTLQALNQLSPDSRERLGIVSLPCHSEAIAKMKTYSSKYRANIDNVRIVIGLFCGWSLGHNFHTFLRQHFDLARVAKFDIPHHPGHTFDVYYQDGSKKEVELTEVKKYTSPACKYCWNMTAEFADVSVGSGRAKYRGWNTLIVRTDLGNQLVTLAREKGLLKTQPLPEENFINLRKASRRKKEKALYELRVKYDGKLGYLGLSESLLRKKPLAD